MKHAWTGGQYSLWRVLCAALVTVAFTHYACATPPVCQGLAESLLDSFGVHLDPESDAALHWRWLPVVSLFAAAAFVLAVGWRDRIAAFVMLVLWLGTGAVALSRGPIGLTVAGVLLLHCATPPNPYGSLIAVGRTDPGGSWILPNWMHASAWFLLALLAVRRGSVIVWPLVFVPLLMPNLALPIFWCASIAFHVATGSATSYGAYSLASIALVHARAFDPGWIPPRDRGVTELVFYDGECGLCHRLVRFLIAEDRGARAFRFAPLHGETYRARLSESVRQTIPDSLVVCTSGGAVLARSRAVLHALERLGGVWRAGAIVVSAVPKPILDFAYDCIARRRHRLFARPGAACPLVPNHLLARFEA